ncbi:aa3-type cytochrome c oxidase subunit IV [Rhodobacteraceae bacterium SC52]|nr:aa3-type cytochrome c oxidase subunit IV [Rhodobacteraceae bacterium SC52]
MAKHEHGKMNIETQEKTFQGFIKASVYVATFAILLLIFIGLVNG